MAEEKVMDYPQKEVKQKLVAWVVDKIGPWRDYRDQNFKARWDEYYRLWRGIWKDTDRSRKSERSKIIIPALQQAIESSVAELEEASFGRKQWFDIEDDVRDENKQDMVDLRNLLLDEFAFNNVPDSVSECFLNGSLYGTGIAEVQVEKIIKRRPATRVVGNETQGGVEEYEQVAVMLDPISPEDFVIDPVARSVEEALGCAHEPLRPLHAIRAKQMDGTYFDDVEVTSFDGSVDVTEKGETLGQQHTKGMVKLIKYFGLVPRALLPIEEVAGEEIVNVLAEEEEATTSADMFENPLVDTSDIDESDLVEAIVYIANESILLMAIENPYMMKDRPIIAYQHDKVPARFWGRGVAEKGYNPQKALDAEYRARIDAMALTSHPMMAMDATKLTTGFKFGVSPGRTLLFNGPPGESMQPVRFGEVNPATFSQSGELERMIQMGTGSLDSATPVGISPRNSTSSGMSMMLGGSIKRTRRTLQNIERTFLGPLIAKAAWRYMQFDPERFPVGDYTFLPKTTLGIMAREYEQAQQIQLLSVVPQDSLEHKVLLKGIYTNSSLTNKEEMMQALDQSMQPPEPDPVAERMQALQVTLVEKQIEDVDASIRERDANTKAKSVEAMAKESRRFAEDALAEAKARRADAEAMSADAKAALDIAMGTINDILVDLESRKKEADVLFTEARATNEAAQALLSHAKAETEVPKTMVQVMQSQQNMQTSMALPGDVQVMELPMGSQEAEKVGEGLSGLTDALEDALEGPEKESGEPEAE